MSSEFTVGVPNERGAPLMCDLCGRQIAGAWRYYLENAEKFWSWVDHGTTRHRHDVC